MQDWWDFDAFQLRKFRFEILILEILEYGPGDFQLRFI